MNKTKEKHQLHNELLREIMNNVYLKYEKNLLNYKKKYTLSL
jgi:hypothetical protein